MLPVKIIIQDRNAESGNALRALLSIEGYSVITIKTQKGLNNLALKFNPNLLIIESNKGEKEAKRILSDIKKDLNIKVIATSCNGSRTYLIEKLGFDDCLIKPYNIEDVKLVIRKQLAA